MANDYATERMNSAFAVLRTELNEMRSQDIQLMKQLLNINNSIQQSLAIFNGNRFLEVKFKQAKNMCMNIQRTTFLFYSLRHNRTLRGMLTKIQKSIIKFALMVTSATYASKHY
jgi:hypothetical protein